jgi:endonuclease/exonuclease/phosphatase family metal-dependent hydrolase
MYKVVGLLILLAGGSLVAQAKTVRIATYNVSMEASNYLPRGVSPVGNELFENLRHGDNQQIRNIAEIIQRVRPDIILLNEFDYTSDDDKGVKAFINNYLLVSQQGNKRIDYPYFYTAPVNTGVASGVDLNHNGMSTDNGGDTFGFGLYPGQYGMLLLSRYPIQRDNIRSFQHFLWQDMPNGLLSSVKAEDGSDWYSPEAQAVFRLSSKSHWDVPITLHNKTVHILASHPTPPVFDGPENRNGKRNHDEIRFWTDYISTGKVADYVYDDKGRKGGINSNQFVILGDLNASAKEGDGNKEGIGGLLNNAKVNNQSVPHSEGGALHSPNNELGPSHTAFWRMRADYVIPSKALGEVTDSGVFWPTPQDPLHRLIRDRQASSDHRLVWVDVDIAQ